MKEKKILVLGLGQNNFLSFLYSALKKKDEQFFIAAPFFVELNKDATTESWMYNNENIEMKLSIFSIVQAIFSCLCSLHFYQTFFFMLCVEKKLSKSFHFIIKQIQDKAFFIANNNFNDFDTFHFHFMQYSYLRQLFFVPKNKKIVCSFWGSDLLRTNDIFNFYFVKKALNRATFITCQSAELREIILSKFGRNLIDKVKVVMFPIEDEIYHLIKKNDNEKDKIKQFKEKYNYQNDKINVVIGHSGSVFNNHLEIIEGLKNIKNISLFHFIVNLNYAISETKKINYKERLNSEFNYLNCSYVVLDTFFSGEVLALSRLATDVFIHAPISDALSSTMLEMIYASSIVITGSWLPYKTFKNAGLDYHEFSEFSDLSTILDLVATDYDNKKEKAKQNSIAIESYFLNDNIVNKWLEIF